MSFPNSICKCNVRLWVACLRHYLAEFAVSNLVGCFPVQDLHGGVVDLVDDGLQVRVRQVVEAGSLGQVAADAPVAVLVVAPLVGRVRVRIVGEHAERLVHEQVAGGFRAVVPGPVDARGRGDVLVDVVFGARGGQRALVGDEPGEQTAALAFDLRVAAPPRRGGADGRVGLIMAELAARAHAFRTFADRLCPQLVDPDTFLCRQVGIHSHIERDTFSLVMNLNTFSHRQVLRFYLELGRSIIASVFRYCGEAL